MCAACILHPRARRCPWPKRGETKHARLPQREPGPGSTAPGTSSPTPVLRPSPSPHGRLRCSLSLFLLLRIAPSVTRCLPWIASPGSVGRRRFLPALTPEARLPPRRPFLPSLSVLDQHRGPPSHNRSHPFASQPAVPHRRVGVPADAWPFDQLRLPFR